TALMPVARQTCTRLRPYPSGECLLRNSGLCPLRNGGSLRPESRLCWARGAARSPEPSRVARAAGFWGASEQRWRPRLARCSAEKRNRDLQYSAGSGVAMSKHRKVLWDGVLGLFILAAAALVCYLGIHDDPARDVIEAEDAAAEERAVQAVRRLGGKV